MGYRHQPQDFGVREEIDFPIDWEIFSRRPLDWEIFSRAPKTGQPAAASAPRTHEGIAAPGRRR